MKESKLETIRCPKCEMEYLPAEIYMPNEFLGKPKNINRTSDNKIDYFSNKSMNLREKYICDNCGCTFKVSAKITFKSEVDSKDDFSSDYISRLDKKYTLFED